MCKLRLPPSPSAALPLPCLSGTEGISEVLQGVGVQRFPVLLDVLSDKVFRFFSVAAQASADASKVF